MKNEEDLNMCTSFVVNRKKTFVGWNLDLLDMKYQVVEDDDKVYIAIYDAKEGWLPLFGANQRGDFIAMPTCWPYDQRSNPDYHGQNDIIHLDIDLLLEKKTFEEIKDIVERKKIASVPGVTFQAQLSNHNGDVLQIVPGQGYQYKQHPLYSIMTNFSPLKGESEKHPWMGLDRYQTAKAMLQQANDDCDVEDCFAILKATAQSVCPTVVSMVYDVSERIIYWCEKQNFQDIHKRQL